MLLMYRRQISEVLSTDHSTAECHWGCQVIQHSGYQDSQSEKSDGRQYRVRDAMGAGNCYAVSKNDPASVLTAQTHTCVKELAD